MCAAIEGAFSLNPVPDDFAIAMLAARRQCVNGALEAIKIVRFASNSNFQRLIVVISANFTFVHNNPFIRSPV